MTSSGIQAYAAGADRQEIVARYSHLVRKIAHHLSARLPDSVQIDDLLQAGMVGLIEAMAKYDVSKGASFETYAGIRIRGSMLDEVRRGDWAPRSVHRNARRLTQAIRDVEHTFGREASDKEVAAHLGMTPDEYGRMLNDAASTRLFSFEEVLEATEGGAQLPRSAAADHSVERDELQQRVAEAIAQLPEREQLVIALYYDEELNLKEIGAVLGVSESRVSQIMSQAVLRIRSQLQDEHD